MVAEEDESRATVESLHLRSLVCLGGARLSAGLHKVLQAHPRILSKSLEQIVSLIVTKPYAALRYYFLN